MQRIRPIFFFIFWLLSSAGCVIPFAYPAIDCTPPLHLPDEEPELHVFRVDVSQHRADIGVEREEVLTEIPSQSYVPFQVKLSLTYGFYVFGVALNFPVAWGNDLTIRLYKSGFELVEIRPWQSVDSITWKKLDDVEWQGKSLDKAFPIHQTIPDWFPIRTDTLAPGSKSDAHHKALLFGAAEYMRLADQPSMSSEKISLIAKAEGLRQLAAQ